MGDLVAATWGWDPEDQRRRFDAAFAPEQSLIVVADGSDVGVLTVVRRPAEVWLDLVELLPAYQGRGLGTAIVRDVVADAHRDGLPVALQVLKNNPARRLYARLGFQVEGETPTHLRMRLDVARG